MREVPPSPELERLLADFGNRGGVLEFVFLQAQQELPASELHRAAALAGMAAIDRFYEEHARRYAVPLDARFRITWDATRLVGEHVSFETFWGTDDEVIRSGVVPNVNGYKTAFFLPPYNMRGDEQEKQQLFAHINALTLGPDPSACEIFSWGTDWSNYFDAGKEWWGTFFWTLRQPGSDLFTVIGASSTD
jgi:hypothetical protein